MYLANELIAAAAACLVYTLVWALLLVGAAVSPWEVGVVAAEAGLSGGRATCWRPSARQWLSTRAVKGRVRARAFGTDM